MRGLETTVSHSRQLPLGPDPVDGPGRRGGDLWGTGARLGACPGNADVDDLAKHVYAYTVPDFASLGGGTP